MARPSGEKTRCSGSWTESKFNSFLRNQLRGASRKWAPISQVKKDANVARGLYLCACCEKEVPVSVRVDGKRVNNVFVDHIEPIVDPIEGFISFDVYIERMFVEKEGLQLLCGDCHDTKTKEENALRAEIRKKNK